VRIEAARTGAGMKAFEQVTEQVLDGENGSSEVSIIVGIAG
jgi:hypothetical protein